MRKKKKKKTCFAVDDALFFPSLVFLLLSHSFTKHQTHRRRQVLINSPV